MGRKKVFFKAIPDQYEESLEPINKRQLVMRWKDMDLTVNYDDNSAPQILDINSPSDNFMPGFIMISYEGKEYVE